MALWLIRAGQHGEFEKKFLDDKRVYLTWKELARDLSVVESQPVLREILAETYPDASKGKISNHSGQIWAFSHRMQPGDWVVLPSKLKPAIHVGEITGQYVFDARAGDLYFHQREVKWIEEDIPRSNFDQDLLYSFGFMTICRIERNDAEARVRAMARSGWKTVGVRTLPVTPEAKEEDIEPEQAPADLEQLARDQIAKLIFAKFKGHGMARLVGSILKAQGYTTYLSPAGPDKGIDLLAAPGPMGFGQPGLCVQVESGDSPVDRPTLDQLIGAMQNVQAEHSLLVSWGGFKATVSKEEASQFFKVRLWNQNDLIEQLLEHYDRLDGVIRAELPLKPIWTVAILDEDS